MFEPIIGSLLQQGRNLDEAVLEAQSLARQAFSHARRLQRVLEKNPRTNTFRQEILEPLIRKEREVLALQERVNQGGSHRVSDQANLSALLRRRQREYELLRLEVPYHQLPEDLRGVVSDYLEARRREIYLGDAERFRRAALEYLEQAALAC